MPFLMHLVKKISDKSGETRAIFMSPSFLDQFQCEGYLKIDRT